MKHSPQIPPWLHDPESQNWVPASVAFGLAKADVLPADWTAVQQLTLDQACTVTITSP